MDVDSELELGLHLCRHNGFVPSITDAFILIAKTQQIDRTVLLDDLDCLWIGHAHRLEITTKTYDPQVRGVSTHSPNYCSQTHYSCHRKMQTAVLDCNAGEAMWW